MSLATPGIVVARSLCIVFVCFTNHEHHNQDALLAVTKLPAALFLFRAEKKTHGITWNIFVSGESIYRSGLGPECPERDAASAALVPYKVHGSCSSLTVLR